MLKKCFCAGKKQRCKLKSHLFWSIMVPNDVNYHRHQFFFSVGEKKTYKIESELQLAQKGARAMGEIESWRSTNEIIGASDESQKMNESARDEVRVLSALSRPRNILKEIYCPILGTLSKSALLKARIRNNRPCYKNSVISF